MMGWKAPKLDPKKMDEVDPYALLVLSAVLSGHDNSRLNRELVRNQRLANSAVASYELISRGPELFVIAATAAKGQTVQDLERGIMKTLGDIANQGVTELELKRIKAQLLASQIYKRDSIFAQAMEIGSSEMADVSWRDLDRMIERIQLIQSDQIQHAINTYFVSDGLTIVTLDPQPRSMLAKPRGMSGSLRH
jgi:zinc protease